jgi:hypothetical protein
MRGIRFVVQVSVAIVPGLLPGNFVYNS